MALLLKIGIVKKKKKDNNAFCFKLNNKKIYNIKKDQYAICCRTNNGPSFWDGKSNYAFIWCEEEFFTSKNNHTCRVEESSFDNIEKNYEINNGEKNFQISEIEVFQILII